MRTQKTAHSLGSTWVTRNRLPYVCSNCRHKAFHTRPEAYLSHKASHNLQHITIDARTSTGQRISGLSPKSRRRFYSTEATSSHPKGGGLSDTARRPEVALKVRDGTKAEDALRNKNHPTRDDIRVRLRQWSEEQSRLAEASGTTAPKFPGLPAPNSLLLDDLEEEDEFELLGIQEDHLDDDGNTEQGILTLNELVLKPGDVFHAKLKGVQTQFAVFLGIIGAKPECLLADGRWVIARSAYPNTVVLPGFARREEVDILRSYIALQPYFKEAQERGFDDSDEYTVGDLPLPVTEQLTRRLSRLSEEILSFQRNHTAELDGMYSKFALEHKFNAVSFETIVESCFGKEVEQLSMGARYAIFITLRKNEGRHTIVRNKFDKIDVYFTPQRLYQHILEVTTWARQYQDCAAKAAIGHDVSTTLRKNPLNTFINKARRIILRSRKIRSPTTIGSLGPSNSNQVREDGSVITRETGEILSKDDLSIIEFMWCTYLRKPRAYNDVKAKSVGALILRAIGAYPKMQLNTSIAKLFFREMGLMAPWSEDIDQDLRIPAPGRRGSLHAQNLIRSTDRLSEKLGFTSDPTHIPLEDTMVDLRKDWGDVEVYCIDKPTTSVLDDGFSLEDSTETAGATWVHVHIAHPTAFVQYNSDFRRRAEALTSAIYTSAKLYSMLPENMAYAMSLRPNAAVMTVSSLILENGKVGEIKITAGTIRRIIRLDPVSVAAVLGAKAVEQAVLQVGPTISKVNNYDLSDYQDAERHAPLLHKLRALHAVRLSTRRKEFPDYPKWVTLRSRQDERVSWTEIFDGSRHTRDYHYVGDPTIRITSPRHQSLMTYDGEWESTTDLTGHTMILACESAGRWLKERNIPAIFNGAISHPGAPSVAELNVRPDDGMPLVLPRSLESSKPIPHQILGVAQYVRLTSPLRRFIDNIAQWQIDAYLRAEASGHLQKSGDLTMILPFTAERIESIIQNKGETAQKLALLKRTATVHWSLQAIFRAFHFNEAPLPAIWDAQITRPYFKVPRSPAEYQMPPDVVDMVAFLQPFSLRTLLLKSKEGWEVGVKRYQYLPVKIEYVDTTAKNVYVRAVGPASWKPTQRGPLHCVNPENEGSTPVDDHPTFVHGRL